MARSSSSSRTNTMPKSVIHSVLAAALPFACAGVLCAQAAKPAAPAAPAPARDITGVWMIRNPPAVRALTLATFTKEEPDMTPWALAKYKEAKSSNGGQYTLDTTNDPVVTKCDPPGVP